jgi:UDP-galactopyranose mutase
MNKKVLIIGGGFAGCVAAAKLSKIRNLEIELIEQSAALGSGVRTYFYGNHPYTFGPRHFLTKKQWIYEYLDSIIPMRLCKEHQFITYVENDAKFYGYPIHEDDIPSMPDGEKINKEIELINSFENSFDDAKNLEDYWIKSVGKSLYEKFINQYSKKMWMVNDNKLIDDFGWSPKGTALKKGSREAWDTAISAYPIKLNGYNDYFDIATKDIKIHLNTKISKYNIENKKITVKNTEKTYDYIINTISPDILFDYKYGELPYIGRDLVKIILPVENALPKDVYFAYYAGEENYTRICEYKKFSKYQSNETLITLEIPSKNGKYYPMPFTSEYNRAAKYFNEMPNGVYSIGRAGSYRYQVDIDDCIEQAFQIYEELK